MGTYSGILLKKYQAPQWKGEPETVVQFEEAINQTCGDHIKLFMDKKSTLTWDGKGCMICTASAEILCNANNNGLDIPQLFENLKAENELENQPELQALVETLSEYPTRSKCVMLAWEGFMRMNTQ